MDAVNLHTVAAYAAGLIVTLFLAAYLTPRSWWRRLNARAIFVTVAGAWGIGSLILYATHTPAAAHATSLDAWTSGSRAQAELATSQAEGAKRRTAGPASQHATTADPVAASAAARTGRPFRVHRDLNLRAAPGVHAARLGVVPSGATVTPTGAHDGDWWQITTSINGHQQTGWASSLWLRRSGE